MVSMIASHAIKLFTNSCYHISTQGKAPPHPYKNQQYQKNIPTIPTIPLITGSDEGLTPKTSAFLILRGGNCMDLYQPNFHVSLSR